MLTLLNAFQRLNDLLPNLILLLKNFKTKNKQKMSSLSFANAYSAVADEVANYDDRLLNLQIVVANGIRYDDEWNQAVGDLVDELCQLAYDFGFDSVGERVASLFFELAMWTAQGDLEYDSGIHLMNMLVNEIYPNVGYASRALFVSVAIHDAQHGEPFPIERQVGDAAKLSSWFDCEKDMCHTACWFWQELTEDILPPIADQMEYFIHEGNSNESEDEESIYPEGAGSFMHYYDQGYDFSDDDDSAEEFDDDDFIAARSHDWNVLPDTPPLSPIAPPVPVPETPLSRAVAEIKEALHNTEALPGDSDARVRASGRCFELAVEHLPVFLDENTGSCPRFIATMFTKMAQLYNGHSHRFEALGIDGPDEYMSRAILTMFEELDNPETRVILRSQLLARLRLTPYTLTTNDSLEKEQQSAVYSELIENIPQLIQHTCRNRALIEEIGINDPPLDAGVIDAWNCYELRSGLVERAQPEQPEIDAIEHHGLVHRMEIDEIPEWNDDGGDDGYVHVHTFYSGAVADDDGETWFDADYNHNDYADGAWADY